MWCGLVAQDGAKQGFNRISLLFTVWSQRVRRGHYRYSVTDLGLRLDVMWRKGRRVDICLKLSYQFHWPTGFSIRLNYMITGNFFFDIRQWMETKLEKICLRKLGCRGLGASACGLLQSWVEIGPHWIYKREVRNRYQHLGFLFPS